MHKCYWGSWYGPCEWLLIFRRLLQIFYYSWISLLEAILGHPFARWAQPRYGCVLPEHAAEVPAWRPAVHEGGLPKGWDAAHFWSLLLGSLAGGGWWHIWSSRTFPPRLHLTRILVCIWPELLKTYPFSKMVYATILCGKLIEALAKFSLGVAYQLIDNLILDDFFLLKLTWCHQGAFVDLSES